MRKTPLRPATALLATALLAAAAGVSAQEKYDGYLCCNMRSDGSWISDSNYAENGKRVIPVGTPVSVTGYGRQRINVRIDGDGYRLEPSRRGDTADVMLDYVGYDLAKLRHTYQSMIDAAALPTDEAVRLAAALEAGLTSYTYLADESQA